MARRVRTEAGSAYYGVPIGHLITPDVEDNAQARHDGRPAPPGATTGTDQKRAGQEQQTQASKKPKVGTSANKNKTEGESEVTGFAARGFSKTNLSGPVEVLVGKKKFSAPEGSEVFKSPTHSGRTYVVTPDGNAHVLTSSGELKLTDEESKALGVQVRSKFQSEGKIEEPEEEATWTRLMSIARQIAQAEKVGDESEAKRLLLQFRTEANQYSPESDPREVRTRVNKAAGVK